MALSCLAGSDIRAIRLIRANSLVVLACLAINSASVKVAPSVGCLTSICQHVRLDNPDPRVAPYI